MLLAPHRRTLLLAALAAGLCLRTLGDTAAAPAPRPIAFPGVLPATVLWAWEEPEDLRTADAHTIGVAYLAQTLLLSHTLTVVPRRQPLTLAPGTAVMAVVRIETQPGFHDTPELRAQLIDQAAAQLTAIANRPTTRALQIDFDATLSERPFYTVLLRRLRPQLPVAMPLSITALASWCDGSASSWLGSLPIDEAVPMLFRLGGHTKPYAEKSSITLREPLCRTSLGLSTDESWPTLPSAQPQRIYLFSPLPWQPAQLLAAATLGPSEARSRPASLRIRDDPASLRAGINDTGLHPRPAANDPEAHP